jgi:hypothetical protein
VYQDQKVHLFRASLGFLAEAQPRLENRRGQKAFCTLHFLGDRTNYKAKEIIGKITNLSCMMYLFQMDTFINTYILTFFYCICYQLPTKLEIYCAIQLLIYIVYGNGTIIGFVSFVANLLNKPTDDARKRVIFRPFVNT